MTDTNSPETNLIQELIDKETIFTLIRQTAAWLDNEELELWLKTFSDDATYEITTSSPELGSEMSWWHSDKKDLEKIINEIPEHVRDKAKRLHLISPISAELNNNTGTVLTHFSIYRTEPDGRSSLYVIGKYFDEVIKTKDIWYYKSHKVILDTRILEPFTHLPL